MCTQQLTACVTLNNVLIQNFTFQRSTHFTYSLVEVIYLIIKFNKIKSILLNTTNNDKNGINE